MGDCDSNLPFDTRVAKLPYVSAVHLAELTSPPRRLVLGSAPPSADEAAVASVLSMLFANVTAVCVDVLCDGVQGAQTEVCFCCHHGVIEQSCDNLQCQA